MNLKSLLVLSFVCLTLISFAFAAETPQMQNPAAESTQAALAAGGGACQSADADADADRLLTDLAGGAAIASLSLGSGCVNLASCTSSDDCGGEWCKNGVCRCTCIEGTRCQTKLDCGIGSACYNHFCVCF